MTQHKTKEERRTQILDAAAQCFAEKGYHAASMDELVKSSGLSKGALYWYFKGKREIFRSLLERWMEEYTQALETVVESDVPPREKVLSVFRLIEISGAANPEMLRSQLEFFSVAMRDEEFFEWFRVKYTEIHGLFEKILNEGVRAEQFQPMNVTAVARQMAAMIDGAFVQSELLREDVRDRTNWETMSESFLDLLEH
jgi:AcrR family transcriptional regulator